jgi:chromosome segregation ATPase
MDDSNEEIESLAMQSLKEKSNISATGGKIIGTVGPAISSGIFAAAASAAATSPKMFSTSFDSIGDEKKRKESFFDIVPDMLSSSKEGKHLRDELSANGQALRQKERELVARKIELEAKCNELETDKKKFETAFRSSDRELAEKEKEIQKMNAEKLKIELQFNTEKNNLLRELDDLRDERIALQTKLNFMENQSKNEGDSASQSYLIRIKTLEEEIQRLKEDRAQLTQKKDELNMKIENYEKAVEIVTTEKNMQKKSLNDELEKYKKDLNELSETKKSLVSEIDHLRSQMHEKTLLLDRLSIEKSNYERLLDRDKGDVDKLKSNYDSEMSRLRSEQIKLAEKLAFNEAKLLSCERDLDRARNLLQEKERHVKEMKDELAKAKTDFELQLNLFKKEKEEKDVLLRKCEMLEEQLRKNIEQMNNSSSSRSRRKSKNSSANTSINDNGDENSSENENNSENFKKIERENKKLQNDLKNLTEKLEKTEIKLETMQQHQQQHLKEKKLIDDEELSVHEFVARSRDPSQSKGGEGQDRNIKVGCYFYNVCI